LSPELFLGIHPGLLIQQYCWIDWMWFEGEMKGFFRERKIFTGLVALLNSAGNLYRK
jgi:hypothetical protein